VRERDAVPGGDECLGLDRFVAVAGVDDRRRKLGPAEHVVGQAGGGAMMGADPGLAAELGGGLRTEQDASAALAAAAFTGFALALAAGRVFGDRHVARFGRVRVVQGCAAVAAGGGALVVVAPNAALGLTGWALFGLGLAAVAPTVLGAAPRTGHVPPAVAIASVTTIGYLGSFTGPPAIGALAQATSLSTALIALVAVSAILGLLATPALGGPRGRRRSYARPMTDKWPEDPDDPVDPAFAPLIEAGEGEAEGFELAEADLIRHSEHGDQHSTVPITRDAAGFDVPEDADLDADVYGEGDEEEPRDS